MAGPVHPKNHTAENACTPGACIRGLRLLALAFDYPNPTLFDDLKRMSAGQEPFPGRSSLEAFLDAIERLPLGDWEELYTRSFDFHPESTPYLGYHVWGDRHARGAFLADLKSAQQTAGIALEGDLPDHLALVLSYLAATLEQETAPPASLTRILQPALNGLIESLKRAAPDNPYNRLLEASAEAADEFIRETERRSGSARRPT